jgi:serine/threonine-protein kinase
MASLHVAHEVDMLPDVAVCDLLLEWEDRAAAGRPASPEELCQARPELLVELRRCIDLLGFVSPLLDLDDTADEADTVPAVTGFEILGRLGRGGMGVVYRARDTSLDRVVAIKMPRLGVLLGAATRSRFEREARVLAQLRHPNIVPVHAAGLAGGQPYFVMDYVPQGSLAAQASRLTGQVEVVASLMEKVARAVEHAHQRGILHRDLKPSNILLDDLGEPLVCDFGLAALLESDPEGLPEATFRERDAEALAKWAPRFTRTGARIGTPAYMAPEQFAVGGRASRAADVWALGVILYELLTGRLPFTADDPSALAGAIRATAPPPPSAVCAQLDRRLDAIVVRCLAKDPRARYASAAALAHDLVRWRGRAQSRKRRRRALTFVPALAAIVCTAFYLFRPENPETRHRELTRPALEAIARQETFDLIGPTRPPASFFVREGKSYTRVVPSEDDTFSICADRVGLVELLPEVGLDSYRFDAEVREDRAFPDADLGVYFAHQDLTTTQGPAHLFGYLRIADLGSQSWATTDDRGRRGSRFIMAWIYYCREPGPMGKWEAMAGANQWYATPPPGVQKPPGPWRKLSVEVTPEYVRGRLDEILLAPASRTRSLPNYLSTLPQVHPELREVPGPPPRGGGLGLYVNGCRASFRNCRIVPLTNPEFSEN